MAAKAKKADRDANRDPLSGAPGAHPVGVGAGAALGGAAAGAAAGAVTGPVGAAVGAAIGAVAGGYAGKAAAEAVDPTEEEAYWEENYNSRPYYQDSVPYEAYAPAYRYGWEARGRYPDRTYEEVATDLEGEWERSPAGQPMSWEQAGPAVRDAWDRVDARCRSNCER